MAHDFTKKRMAKNHIEYLQTFGWEKLYRCTKCHNLQTHLPTCTGFDCHRDGTLVDAYTVDPVLVDLTDMPTNPISGISSTS